MSNRISIDGPGIVHVEIGARNGLTVGLPEVRVAGVAEAYGGPYGVTPVPEEQVLQTRGKRLAENVVVNPIPSNYGLISYDGFSLTVS